MTAALEIRDMGIRFGGLVALDAVNIDVPEWEIVGLIGPNGAGKTTLFNCVTGLYQPDSGTVKYRGRDISLLPTHRRVALGLGRTFQNIGLVRELTVLENFLVAQHPRIGYGPLGAVLGAPRSFAEERRLRTNALEVLDFLDLAHLKNQKLDGLPYGTLKLIEIGTVLATDPDVVLLDEPSSGMGPDEAHSFGERLLELRRTLNLTVLMIEHHVPLVTGVCDYVYVLNFGRILTEGKPQQVQSHPEVIAAYLGGEVEETEEPRSPRSPSMPLLEVEDLKAGYGSLPVLQGITFSIEEGETAVLLGLNGAGKTTTVLTLAGMLKAWSGKVMFQGHDVTGVDPRKLVADGIVLVPEGRHVFPQLTVAQNLRLGAWPYKRDRKNTRKVVEQAVEYFPRLSERWSQLAGTLSGGEQQMLAIARGLMARPKLLLIDEASLGLSPKLTQTVFDVVHQINQDGTTVLIVEQNAGVLRIASRAFVMEKGTLVYRGSGEEILDHSEIRQAYLGAPA